MQKIIIIGKPNVGKSSLFNCFLKQRVAVVSEVIGTTRDINIKSIKINNANVTLCDTAGITDETNEIFDKQKILHCINKNDIVLYVVDGGEIIDEYDVKLFRSIKDAILVVNKIDRNNNDDWEYSVFGTKNIFFISALHNRGLQKLKNHLEILLENTKNINDSLLQDLESSKTESNLESNENNNTINIGIIGRVNVGKSSILNALLNKERSVVSTIEGTTIDPVDDKLEYNGKVLNFVDTAGIRKHSKIEGIEKYALERTKKILEKSDIVLLVLDASKPFVDLDEKISGLSDKYQLGIIIILNKWDIKYANFAHIQSEIKRKFAYLSYAPIITVSALSKRNIEDIKKTIFEIYQNFSRRIPTALLNETIHMAVRNHPLPSDKGKMIKIYYATQIDTAPPQIVLVMNRPQSLHFSYKRYLINWLRKHFDFKGTPIIILPRSKNSNISNDSQTSTNIESK